MTMNHPHGLKIWLPRTEVVATPQGHVSLRQTLESQGFNVLQSSLKDVKQLPQRMEPFIDGQHEWVFFTSPLGVRSYTNALKTLELASSPKRMACLGGGTYHVAKMYFEQDAVEIVNLKSRNANEAVDEFLIHNCVIARPQGVAISLDGYNELKPLLWITSELADNTVKDALEAHGFSVDRLNLYRPDDLPVDEQAARLKEARAFVPDVVVLTSSSNLEALQSMGALDALSPKLWLSMGHKTAGRLGDLGIVLDNHDVLTGPTAEAIINACAKIIPI
jgi:uroporphyrinogen-III synthase